jgi:hypothetical protein
MLMFFINCSKKIILVLFCVIEQIAATLRILSEAPQKKFLPQLFFVSERIQLNIAGRITERCVSLWVLNPHGNPRTPRYSNIENACSTVQWLEL